MAAPAGETRKTEHWAEFTPSENIMLLSASRTADDDTVLVRTPQAEPAASASSPTQTSTALDELFTRLTSRPIAPLSTPPKPLPPPQANAGSGGQGIGGKSSSNAGGGGGGPTGGAGGHGLTNANQFVGVNFGEVGNGVASPAAAPFSREPQASADAPSPLTAFQTTYSMTPPTQAQVSYDPISGTIINGTGGGYPSNGSLYVLDRNTGETVPAKVTLNSFSTWGENLWAQVSGVTVSSYSWNVSQAPDLTNVSGTTTANLQGTWANFTGSARTDTLSVTETPQLGQAQTFTITFAVAGTSSPAYSSNRPTSSSTWPTVLTPDQLSSGQAVQTAGPYAYMGQADGSVQTSFAMPSYNPNVAPLTLDYNSTTANAQPIFLTEYQLPLGQSVPSTITAQLTFNNTALATVSYNTSGLNPGDYMQIGLQANATSLGTGRYPWSITVTNGNTPTNYNGNVDIVNGASSPYGAGWSLDNVEQLVPVSGAGVILVEPGGTSLWFANNGSGGYITPAGDFSTLTFSNNVYTQTMPDGTKINFNSSGQETSSVDRDGNTTTFGYSSGLLTTITDMNNQVTTLTYTSGKLTGIEDPALRMATLAYTGSQLTSITDPANDLWQYSYDSANDLTKLTDPNSNATTFVYGSADRISSVTQPDSTTLQLTPMQMNGFAAAGSSNVTAVLLATGDTAQFTDARSNIWNTGLDWLGFGNDVQDADPLGDTGLIYRDTNGLAWMSSDPLARRTREFYNSQGNPTEIVQPDDSYSLYSNYNGFSEPGQFTDPTGYTTTYTYNTKGDLTQKEDALLHTWTYTYNSQGLQTSAEDPLLHTTTYGYNALNEMTTITNALNQTTTYGYNSAGQRSSETDARGFLSTYAYDAMNRLTGATLADTSTTNSVYTYGYDKVGNKTSEIDPLNHTTSYGYDKLNRLSTITDALNEVTTYTHDGNGNLTGLTNPLNQTTTYGFDAANRLTTITNALNQTTTIAYDAAGEKTSETDPLGHTTTYGYTVLGQLASVSDPVGDVFKYSYNSAGDETSTVVTGPNTPTGTTNYDYNGLHQQTAAFDALQQETIYTYDADGNLIGVTDPLNHTITYGYNAINELTSVTDALNHTTTYGYDADGNRTSSTDPLNRATTSSYDAQRRLLSATDPLNGTTSYAYDLAGNQTRITDPDNNTTSYTYDAVNQLTKMTDPLGHSATYAYNAAGEQTSTTDRDGRTITYGYDAVGHETSETWVSGSYTATYAYNAGGLLTSASDPYSSYTYGYDAANRQTSVDNNGTPGVPHIQLDYSYNAYGNRTQLTDNQYNSIAYTWDIDQRLTELQFNTASSTYAQVTFGYDAASRLTSITRSGTGDHTIQSNLSYDNADKLTNITATDTTAQVTLANYTYGYDAANQLTSYQDNNNSSLTYGYDKGGQLTSAAGTLNGSSYNSGYSYDANGNRTMTGYTTGTNNELTSDGTYSYTYDNNGNMTSQTKISTGYVTYYSWDYRNRLTEVKQEDNHGNVLNDEKFTSDVNNNRIGVSLNGVQQSYTVYDGANPYMDFNGSGALNERYLTNPQTLSQFYAQVSAAGTVQWLLTDNINSIRQVVSTSGSVLDAITYDPYGSIANQTNSANAPRFLYGSGAFDSITGNDQFNRRYYDPVVGRWVSQDPLGFRAYDANLYRYTFNHPDMSMDPSGEILIMAGFIVIGIGVAIWGGGKAMTYSANPKVQEVGKCVMVAGAITIIVGVAVLGAGVWAFYLKTASAGATAARIALLRSQAAQWAAKQNQALQKGQNYLARLYKEEWQRIMEELRGLTGK